MFLQLSLPSGDLIKKGNVFTTVFTFWRLDKKRKRFYNCLYLLETWWTKEIFLQVSLSSGDLMKKGNVFTTLFIFWRLDGKKEMFLQVSLPSGDLTKKENVFTTVFIFWRSDKSGYCICSCLYLLDMGLKG